MASDIKVDNDIRRILSTRFEEIYKILAKYKAKLMPKLLETLVEKIVKAISQSQQVSEVDLQKFLETTIAKNKKINNELKKVEEKVIAFFAYVHDDWNLTTGLYSTTSSCCCCKKI